MSIGTHKIPWTPTTTNVISVNVQKMTCDLSSAHRPPATQPFALDLLCAHQLFRLTLLDAALTAKKKKNGVLMTKTDPTLILLKQPRNNSDTHVM